MKSLIKYVSEKLVINKNYKNAYTYFPKTFDELRKIIEDKYNKLGPGTEQKPVYFNDIDVSGMTTFYDEKRSYGVFQDTQFEYIDISDWNVSNIEDMNSMFLNCKNLKSVDLSDWLMSDAKDLHRMFEKCINLKSVGNLSKWDVSSVEDISNMFRNCYKLESVGNLSKWKVSTIKYMYGMFDFCEELKSVGDLSKWDVYSIEDISTMFRICKNLKSVGDLSKWNASGVSIGRMFDGSGITNIPDWYNG